MGRKELVRVAVIFEPGKRLRPVWFDRKHHKHTITEVTSTWQDRIGDKPQLHFSVTDGETLYELVFSPLDGDWALVDQTDRVIMPGKRA